jgi:hypothetical protein
MRSRFSTRLVEAPPNAFRNRTERSFDTEIPPEKLLKMAKDGSGNIGTVCRRRVKTCLPARVQLGARR